MTAKLSHKFSNPKETEQFYREYDEMPSAGSKPGSKSSLVDSKSFASSELSSASSLPSISSASNRLSTNTTQSSLHMSKSIPIVSYQVYLHT